MTRRLLVLLDRDGVLNRDSPNYVKSVEELEIISGSAEAAAALSNAGHSVVVVTNQSGIARGLIEPNALTAIHASIDASVVACGGQIDHFQVCPHSPQQRCPCRKPETGLIVAARAQLADSFDQTLFVGDRITDLQAAIASGCHPILVRTGHGAATERQITDPNVDPVIPVDARVDIFDDLACAVDAILGGMFDDRPMSA